MQHKFVVVKMKCPRILCGVTGVDRVRKREVDKRECTGGIVDHKALKRFWQKKCMGEDRLTKRLYEPVV